MRNDNIIAKILFFTGLIVIVIGIITGISEGNAENEFGISVMLYWWLSSIFLGLLFIGLSEIINLLQALVDKKAGIEKEYNVQANAETSRQPSFSTKENNADNKDFVAMISFSNVKMEGIVRVQANKIILFKKKKTDPIKNMKLLYSIDLTRTSGFAINSANAQELTILHLNEGGSEEESSVIFDSVTDVERFVGLLQGFNVFQRN